MVSHPQPAYSDETFHCVITALYNGDSLRKICKRLRICRVHLLEWIDSDEVRHSHYARAREAQGDVYADEIIDLRSKATPANAHAIRVQIDARRWIAAKLKPRVYGERANEINVDARQQIVVLSEEKTRELQERIKRLRDTDTQ